LPPVALPVLSSWLLMGSLFSNSFISVSVIWGDPYS